MDIAHKIWHLLTVHREWLFGGVGVVFLSFVLSRLYYFIFGSRDMDQNDRIIALLEKLDRKLENEPATPQPIIYQSDKPLTRQAIMADHDDSANAKKDSHVQDLEQQLSETQAQLIELRKQIELANKNAPILEKQLNVKIDAINSIEFPTDPIEAFKLRIQAKLFVYFRTFDSFMNLLKANADPASVASVPPPSAPSFASPL